MSEEAFSILKASLFVIFSVSISALLCQ